MWVPLAAGNVPVVVVLDVVVALSVPTSVFAGLVVFALAGIVCVGIVIG